MSIDQSAVMLYSWVTQTMWPSVPDFLGESRFLTTIPEKITVLSGCPFVAFLAWCARFVPTLINCATQPYEY